MRSKAGSCCRYCSAPLRRTFVDLGLSPLANVYVEPEKSSSGEKYYPLHAYVCGQCLLVQVEDFETPGRIFSEYAYFSSYSETWLKHASEYADRMTERFGLGKNSQVVEIASNDGYLLKNFVRKGIPVLGVEPAANVARAARARGIPTQVSFFGRKTARALAAKGRSADLLLGNNVLAHVPDLRDFVGGLKILLKREGVLTMEFPHVLRMIRELQFDTIYHEHFSYFSFFFVERMFKAHGLIVFDVEELPTHGGSLRVFARHAEYSGRRVEDRVHRLRATERAAGLQALTGYMGFQDRVAAAKRRILKSLIALKDRGKSVVAYGAPAKGNTLLNYCGIGTDFIASTFDYNPYKQGRLLPGTRIPIRPPKQLKKMKPDYVVILPWNIKDEIMRQFSFIRKWGGRFMTLVPTVRVYS
jgi:2-polyprenyl-3-methyl-5-hydroxy-6-metoxy-1,4-benzoquinol methylase